MKRIYYFLLLFFVCMTVYAKLQEPYTFQSEKEAQRYAKLTNEIRCVVCQNQSLSESSAPLAKDLRLKIYLMIKAKQDDIEIKAYLVKRYGEFILLRPLVNKTNFLLWSFPFMGLVIMFIVFYRIIKRKYI